MKSLSAVITAVCLVLLAGCRGYKTDFVEKTPEQLAVMNQQSLLAHKLFLDNKLQEAEQKLRPLLKERTINFLLYQQELISVLLLGNKHKEALELMLLQHQNWNFLFSPAYEKKAEAYWGGSESVYRASAYERTFFYLLTALSCIHQNNLDDALRYVKYGLAADSGLNAYSSQAVYDSVSYKYNGSCAMLCYLGYLICSHRGEKDAAEQLFNKMLSAVKKQQCIKTAVPKENSYEFLKNPQVNVLLVVWHGQPPCVVHDADSGQKVVVRGADPAQMLSAAIDDGETFFFAPHMGDMNVAATTFNNTVLSDVRNWGQIIVDRDKKYRYLYNLPGSLSILPLRLSAGNHKVFLSVHNRADRSSMKVFDIKVSGNRFDVIHLSLLQQGRDIGRVRDRYWQREWQKAVSNAGKDRLSVEVML